MWKDWIRPFIRPLPQWATVAVASPQQTMTATLHWDGQSADVTADHTVASLMPLTIALSIDAGQRPLLEYHSNPAGTRLGELRLVRTGSIVSDGVSITLYHVASGTHRCLRWPRRPWNAWLQGRAMRKNRIPNHMVMEPDAVQQLMIAYLCPQPVVLVSVESEGHRNIFPMDLIGPLERSGFYSLALRSTNASETIMRAARGVALSQVPGAMKDVVYKLSAHHKQPPSDWQALPFPVRPSREFGIPAVGPALGVRELSIVHSEAIGSHTFFLCRIVSDEVLAEGGQLHHAAGFLQTYLRRHGQALTEV